MMATDIPREVSALRLVSAFRDLAVNVMDCIATSDADPVYVVDDDETKSSRLADAREVGTGGFTARNPGGKTLCLLSIDNKLMSNVAGGIADCAVFSSDNFSFVEFKTNAEGRSRQSVDDTYEGAIRQIVHTLGIFRERLQRVGIDFDNHIEITPHVVVSHRFPRSSQQEQNLMISFFETTGLPLSFDDYHEF